MRYNLSISDVVAEAIEKKALETGKSNLDVIRGVVEDKFGVLLGLDTKKFKLIQQKNFDCVVGGKFIVIKDNHDWDTSITVIELPEEISWFKNKNIKQCVTAIYLEQDKYLLCCIETENRYEILFPNSNLNELSLTKGNNFSIINGKTLVSLFNKREIT